LVCHGFGEMTSRGNEGQQSLIDRASQLTMELLLAQLNTSSRGKKSIS